MAGSFHSEGTREPAPRARASGSSSAPYYKSPVRAAQRRIVDRWDEISAGWMAEEGEASDALAFIVHEIECSMADSTNGGSEVTPRGEVTRPLLHDRLAEALKVELIGAWTRAPEEHDSDTTLAALSSLESYRSRLWPDPREDVAARLAEPDAFELVVELAHDIRSPLNSILFLSEVLRSGHSGPVNDHQRSQLGLVYSATLGIISVVSDVMELATERRGSTDDDPGPFSIAKVFDSVREMVRPMAEEKGLRLTFDLPDYDRYVGHPNRLGRVLLNLTTNALKFTEEGGVSVVARKVDRTGIEFSVRDSGRGIDPDGLDHLFHPFRKSEYRAGHFFSGSGLGLSIARRLVRAMDSELEVESEVGTGTRFYFRVDLSPVTSP